MNEIRWFRLLKPDLDSIYNAIIRMRSCAATNHPWVTSFVSSYEENGVANAKYISAQMRSDQADFLKGFIK